MAKDERLYMTFPNDIHRHPKLTRISVEARWAFVEMNGEARINDNDGVFVAEDAEFMWSPELLGELVNSHPSKPLVNRVGDTYVIREYAKHQQTKADREAISQKKTEAANKRWEKHRERKADASGSNAGASQVQSKTMPESESESESQLPDLVLTESVSLGSNAREESTGLTQEEIDNANRTASGLGVDLGRIIRDVVKIDRALNHREALLLAVIIIDKAKSEPKKPAAYVSSVIKNSPFEVQKWIDTEVMA